MRTLLGFLTSPVSLLAVLLTLLGALVLLRGVNLRLLRQTEVLLTEMKHMRKALRVYPVPHSFTYPFPGSWLVLYNFTLVLLKEQSYQIACKLSCQYILAPISLSSLRAVPKTLSIRQHLIDSGRVVARQRILQEFHTQQDIQRLVNTCRERGSKACDT